MNNALKPGRKRFAYFMSQLETAIITAAETSNPAESLYQQKTRNIFFMLEALGRTYTKVHPGKTLEKLTDKFKKLEDFLGKVDYYDSYYNYFSLQPNIPAPVLDFLELKKNAWLEEMNFYLEEKNWLSKKQKQLKKINAKLDEVNWLEEAEDTNEIRKFYAGEIDALITELKNNEIDLDHIENGLHEYRRKLRWLSIYPQACRGLFILIPTIATPDYLQKYFTAEIVTSPFNVLAANEGSTSIELSKAHFLAMSWMIAETGKLKDIGLKIIVLQEAMMSLYHNDESQALELAYPLIGAEQSRLETILAEAKMIVHRFYDEQVLENLLR